MVQTSSQATRRDERPFRRLQERGSEPRPERSQRQVRCELSHDSYDAMNWREMQMFCQNRWSGIVRWGFDQMGGFLAA